ncbi:MAG: HIT domain-containing protein [bacterium]
MSQPRETSGKILWAPWRACYVQEKKRGGCVFCQALEEVQESESLVLRVARRVFVMMNRYPYAHGHLLVSPLRHVPDLEGLTSEEAADLMEETRLATRVLTRVLNPEGFNVGINLGKVAGAGYAGHLHVHVVPRWNGDLNFMPILADVRVISEHLQDTYFKLKREFTNLGKEDPK